MSASRLVLRCFGQGAVRSPALPVSQPVEERAAHERVSSLVWVQANRFSLGSSKCATLVFAGADLTTCRVEGLRAVP